jgi:hypothetical protein
MFANAPWDEHASGVAFISLDDKLVPAEVHPREPRQVVLAAHVNVIESAGRNAIPIVNQESHQAHGGTSLGTIASGNR